MDEFILSPSVTTSVLKQFSAEDACAVLSELRITPFPLINSEEERERLHFALLYLSRGELLKFKECIKYAQSDWRDVLVGAGLAYGNWKEVLKRRASEGV